MFVERVQHPLLVWPHGFPLTVDNSTQHRFRSNECPLPIDFGLQAIDYRLEAGF